MTDREKVEGPDGRLAEVRMSEGRTFGLGRNQKDTDDRAARRRESRKRPHLASDNEQCERSHYDTIRLPLRHSPST